MTRITIVDGATTIGGSKILVEADGATVLLDFGLNFKRYGCYFEEFVKPRSPRGIYDLIHLGLAPKLPGLYRADLFPPDFPKLAGAPLQVDALFLSHAHLDHTGLVGLLRTDIPVYASSMTAVIAKAIQDTGSASVESEITYTTPKEIAKCDERALGAVRGARVRRRFFAVDQEVRVAEDLAELNALFWNESFASNVLPPASIAPAGGKIGSLEFKAFPVDHSIFGATAYAFKTGSGWIAYTGDFRLHGMQAHPRLFIEGLAALKPKALIIEGTNVEEERRAGEKDVLDKCLAAVNSAAGSLVIADFGPRNFQRLQTFLAISKETRRQLVITTRDAFLLWAMRLADASLPDVLADPNLLIFNEIRAGDRVWERDYVRRWFGSKYIGPVELGKDAGRYIVCFSFWDTKHLLDIKPAGGIYIYSSSEAFSEEQEMDVWRLSNWLGFFGVKPVGFSLPAGAKPGEPCAPDFVSGFHASGHAAGDDLVEVIGEIEPEIVIPVHTERAGRFTQRLAEAGLSGVRVVLPVEGRPIEL